MKNTLSNAIKIAIPLIIVSATSSNTIAADSVKFAEDGSLELSITANRRPQAKIDTLAPITVITRAQIETYQATKITDVLRRVPGINISNNGGDGKNTSVFLRGTNSGHVLVLIDGIRHGSATLGSTAFQHIPLSQVERIEVVRGPRSSLYGSEAIGGVIQIFTRKGSKDGFKPSVELSLGSNDTYQGNINLSGGNSNAWYNAQLQSKDTVGIDACNSTTAGCFADEPDKDGYHQDSISLRAGRQFGDKVTAEISLLRAEGDTEFDGSFQNQADIIQQVISGNISTQISDKLKLRFQVGQSRDESNNFKDGTFSSRFNTKRDSASLIADITLNQHYNMLIGADWHDDQIDSTTQYGESSRDNKAIFATFGARINKTQIDLSLRDDDNQQFGSTTTGGIAMSQKLTNRINLKASYGTAFKAPTFNQLYFPNFGNADLKPEESENYEIGLNGQLNKGSWELNLFENQIENLIAGFPVGNVDEARIRGLEAVYNTKLAGFDVATNVTLQKPENVSGANAGKLLRERPKKILNLDLDRKFGRFSFGASVHAESQRFTKTDNSDKLGGYATLGLRSEYQLAKSWRVSLNIENALDKDYATKKGYNQDGINGMLTIKYAPK